MKRKLSVLRSQQESVSFRIAIALHKIGLALRHQAWEGAGERGLTPTQGQVLALLGTRSRDKVRLSDVASALAVSAPTVSDCVRTLVDKKLVKREPDPDDARAFFLRLTPLGRREAERAKAWPDFLARAVDELSVSEQEIFLIGLIKMIRALEARGEIPAARMCVTCTFFRPHVHADPARPHHCAFVDVSLSGADLKTDCGDHEAALPDARQRIWETFMTNAVRN